MKPKIGKIGGAKRIAAALKELRHPSQRTLNEVAKAAHDMAREKGFWDGDAADVTKKLLLIHSEVSEAAEEVRGGKMIAYRNLGGEKPEGLPTELADVLIRTLDLMHGLGIDVEKAVEEKMAYNATRGPKHGKRF